MKNFIGRLKLIQQGFTFIELILVVAIVIIIGTFSSVFFGRFLIQNAVANTQDQLVGELRKAQLYAMAGRQNGNWGVQFSSNIITLYQGASFATRNSAFDEKFNVNSNILITGFSEVNFARMTGLPSTTGTYTITGTTSSDQVIINSQGVVSR